MNEHIECQWENCSGGQFCEKHSLEQAPCPLTNSSHEKALVRVVDRESERSDEELVALKNKGTTFSQKRFYQAIQVLCPCGTILSENPIK